MEELGKMSYSEEARRRLAARPGAWTEEDQKRVDQQYAWIGTDRTLLTVADLPEGLLDRVVAALRTTLAYAVATARRRSRQSHRHVRLTTSVGRSRRTPMFQQPARATRGRWRSPSGTLQGVSCRWARSSSTAP